MTQIKHLIDVSEYWGIYDLLLYAFPFVHFARTRFFLLSKREPRAGGLIQDDLISIKKFQRADISRLQFGKNKHCLKFHTLLALGVWL